MKVYSNLRLDEDVKFILKTNNLNFPLNPELGEIAFVEGVLYTYTSIDDVETWYPLTNKSEHFVHQQLLPAISWTITHNLDSKDLIIMVYDENDELQLQNTTFINNNTIELSFTEALIGRCVIFASSNKYASGGTTIVGGSGGTSSAKVLLETTLDGTTRTFQLNEAPSDTDILQVFLEGILYSKNRDYTLLNDTITFDSDIYIEPTMYLIVYRL